MKKKSKTPKKSALEVAAAAFQETAARLGEMTNGLRSHAEASLREMNRIGDAALASARRAEDAEKRAEELLSRAGAEVGKLEAHIQSIAALTSGEQFQNATMLGIVVAECRASAHVCREIRRELDSARGGKSDEAAGGRFGIDDVGELDV